MKNKGLIIVTIVLVVISFLGGATLSTVIINQKSESVAENTKDKKDDNSNQKANYTFSDINKIIDTYGDYFIKANSFNEVSKEDLRMTLFNNAFHMENKNISLEEFNKIVSDSPFNGMGIEPGDIPTRNARITKPFYIGVFELTQHQYELIMGSNPVYAWSDDRGDNRPVCCVSYNMIRGSSFGALRYRRPGF